MTSNPNALTIENSAVLLIDHQPWVAFAVESIDRNVLINNVTGLALAAKTLRGADCADDGRGEGKRAR